MNAQELTDYFYRDIKGHSVDFDSENKTKLTLDYLFESGLEKEEIINLLIQLKNVDYLTPKKLPDSLWIINEKVRVNKRTGETYTIQDNLVKRDTFYFHPRLMLRSPMPKIVKGKEVLKPYYCEPVCRFTVKNLAEYFCSKSQVNIMFVNDIQLGQELWYYLRQYRDFCKVFDVLDLLLFSIDFAADNDSSRFSSRSNFKSVSQLQQYFSVVIEDLKTRVLYIQAYGYDKIVWRTE